MVSNQRVSAAATPLDTVAVIVSALRAKFGDGALAVAENQARVATEESDASWAEIVEHLRG